MAEHGSTLWRLVEGQDIRAVEGLVIAQEPARGWKIAERKGNSVFRLQHGDIIVGLVRPERRNVGLLISNGDDIVGSPDGIAVIRLRPGVAQKYSHEWLFAKLRSEEVRLQFWTDSGGTSYGKLSDEHILNVLLSTTDSAKQTDAAKVKTWFGHHNAAIRTWATVGTAADRKPILNSPIFGLEWPSDGREESDDTEDEE